MRIYPVKRPLCAMILAFIAGLWLSNVSSLLAGGCVFLCLAATLIYALHLRQRWVALACLVASVGGFLFMSHTTALEQELVPYHNKEVQIEAQIVRAPANRTYVDAAVTALNEHDFKEPVNIRIKRPWEDATTYDIRGTYQFNGTLVAPAIQTNPGGYDEASMLAQRGIYSVLETTESGSLIHAPASWAQAVNHLKGVYTNILSHYLNDGEQALIAATLFGDVAAMSEDFYMASQQFGIIHIFSVSGLHVTFILGFILALAKLLRRQNSWGLLLLLVPLLTLYTLLSDASAPAIRASLMGILTLLALRLLRYRDPLTIVALAAFMLLIANPYNLWQIGFQLSFLAMLGLILIPQHLAPYFHRLPSWLADGIALSLAAELVSLPLVAYYFYTVSPLSTVMNLLVVPFFSLLVPLSLVALLVAGVLPALGGLFFLPVKAIITVIMALMNIIHHFVGTLHFHIGQPALGLLCFYYLGLLLFLLVPLNAPRIHALALTAVCALVAALCLRPAAPADLRLSMFDVGQGTGCAYQSTNGDWLVFDTGPGSDTLAQSLRYYGVNRIDTIVLSHGDADHIGGLAHLLRDFHVKQLIASPAAQTGEEWQMLTPYIKDTAIINANRALTFHADGLSLECVLRDIGTDDKENANQVIARLTDSNTSYLFTGDSNADTLTNLPWQEPTDVIIVPHHGSKNSWNEDFYQTQDPRLALISAGRGNRYGHPHKEVTDGLTALAIPTYNTAENGAIQLYNTVNGLAIGTFLKNQRPSP